MQNTATMTLNQNVRNQMSIMAWGMAALCAWVLFLAAYASAAPTHTQPYAPAASTQR